ncbi:MAG TPA: M50 family metallopeptidase [Candidatus Angelobacter sp.]
MSTPASAPISSATPFLDRLSSLPGPTKPGWLKHVYDVFIAILTIYLPLFAILAWPSPAMNSLRQWLGHNMMLIYRDYWGILRLIVTAFLVYGAWLVALAIHELGHLLAGTVLGFRWKSVRIAWIKVDRPLRFSRYRTEEFPVSGRAVFAAPEMKNHRWKCTAMFVAGPLANLASGVLVLWMPYEKSFVSGAFIVTSFYLGVVNLLPFSKPHIDSDGMRILTIVLRPHNHERALALAHVMENIQAGTSIEDLPPILIKEITAVRDNSFATVLSYLMAYGRAYDQKDERAAEYLETCLRFSGSATPKLRGSLIVNAAIYQAVRRNQSDLARQWQADLPNDILEEYRPRIDGAIAESEGDFVRAILKVEVCLKQAEKIQNERTRTRLISKLAEWKDELQEKLAKTAGQ